MDQINAEEFEDEDPEIVAIYDRILKDCNPRMTLADFRRYLIARFGVGHVLAVSTAIKLWGRWLLTAKDLPGGWMRQEPEGTSQLPYREQRVIQLVKILEASNFTFDSRMLDVIEYLKQYCDQKDIQIMAYKLWRDGEVQVEPVKRLRVHDELLVQQMVQEMKKRRFSTVTPYKVVSDLLKLMCPEDEYLRGIAFARWFDAEIISAREKEAAQPPYPVTHRRLGITLLIESEGQVRFHTDAATAESLRKYDHDLHREHPKSNLWIMHIDSRWDFAEVFRYLRWLEKQPAVEPLAA